MPLLKVSVDIGDVVVHPLYVFPSIQLSFCTTQSETILSLIVFINTPLSSAFLKHFIRKLGQKSSYHYCHSFLVNKLY